MIFAIDVGNTHIVLGCMENHEIKYLSRMATNRLATESEYAVTISRLLEFAKLDVSEFDGAIVSSVVPPLTNTIKEAVKLITGINPVIVGSGIKTGINIRIDDPAELGADLVTGAAAALKLYEPPLIIIDMGTATTITVLNEKGDFVGGALAPGVGTSMRSLISETSQLPSISLEAPRACIGKNTVECMKSGAIFGAASMIDGMIDRMEQEIGRKATVVATGGLANYVVPHCTHEMILNEELLLYGLDVIYEKNKKETSRKKL